MYIIKYRDSRLLRSLLDPEDGGIRIFRNVGKYRTTKHNMAVDLNVQQPRCEAHKYRIIQDDLGGKVKCLEVTIGYLRHGAESFLRS